MEKQRINLYVGVNLWRVFRAGCVRRGKSASETIDQLMQEQVRQWEIEEAQRDARAESSSDPND